MLDNGPSSEEFALKAMYQVDVSGGTCTDALAGLWKGQLDSASDEQVADQAEIDFASRIVEADGERQDIDDLIEVRRTGG